MWVCLCEGVLETDGSGPLRSHVSRWRFNGRECVPPYVCVLLPMETGISAAAPDGSVETGASGQNCREHPVLNSLAPSTTSKPPLIYTELNAVGQSDTSRPSPIGELWISTKFALKSDSFQRLNVHLASSSSLISVLPFSDVKNV